MEEFSKFYSSPGCQTQVFPQIGYSTKPNSQFYATLTHEEPIQTEPHLTIPYTKLALRAQNIQLKLQDLRLKNRQAEGELSQSLINISNSSAVLKSNEEEQRINIQHVQMDIDQKVGRIQREINEAFKNLKQKEKKTRKQVKKQISLAIEASEKLMKDSKAEDRSCRQEMKLSAMLLRSSISNYEKENQQIKSDLFYRVQKLRSKYISIIGAQESRRKQYNNVIQNLLQASRKNMEKSYRRRISLGQQR